MAVAGYMPNEAIEFHKGKPKIVPLAFDTRRRLQTSGEIVIGGKDAVQRFIREYVLGQDIDSVNVKDAVIDEFLTTENEQRRLDLGHNLLGLITDKATEHLKATYLLARQRELTMPVSLLTFVNSQKLVSDRAQSAITLSVFYMESWRLD